MKGNYRLLKILIAVVVVAVIAAILALMTIGNPQEEPTAATEPSSVTETTERTSVLTTAETTAASTTETTTESTTQAEPAFLQKGNWYLFDKKNTACYVFTFDGKGNVDIAMFDSNNIEVGDPQYFEGYAAYSVSGDTLTIAKLPSALPLGSVELTVGKDSLTYEKQKLENHKDISVDYALQYFGME